MRAYIVITVGPGKARDVARAVTKLTAVKMANACWGSPDVFAVVEVSEQKDLDKLVLDKIQKIEGVGRTETHIAID
ncbi:MAG TPA: Lrp/AsnC ligand binding domain-containing protein [Candidatus Acidoferrales bacterium]|nr:Lrp/AsnC ligand binding domain-containing protein [Candidatus Acidoferrales bacterium]